VNSANRFDKFDQVALTVINISCQVACNKSDSIKANYIQLPGCSKLKRFNKSDLAATLATDTDQGARRLNQVCRAVHFHLSRSFPPKQLITCK
jgi:hypothetical protein